MPHIGIIGGGLAGLTVAYRRERLGDRVSLFEASPRLGGQLHSERSGAFLIEHGAEGFVAGSPALAELARSLGIESRVIDQDVSVSCSFDGEKLLRLAPGEAGRRLGFQVGERAFGKGIQSFLGGMDELAQVLRAQLGDGARCALETPIATVRRDGERWSIVPAHGTPTLVDAVVVAIPAHSAARLLADEFGAAASELAESEASSSVTVSLAFPRDAVEHPLDATGFVVAEDAQAEGFRACTFVSSKLRGRAPVEHALLRLFFRPSDAELQQLGDVDWAERALRSARRALPVRAEPEHAWISRWARALPVFDAAHRARVARLEDQLRGSGVSLAGAAFHAPGIDGAVRSAEATASALGR